MHKSTFPMAAASAVLMLASAAQAAGPGAVSGQTGVRADRDGTASSTRDADQARTVGHYARNASATVRDQHDLGRHTGFNHSRHYGYMRGHRDRYDRMWSEHSGFMHRDRDRGDRMRGERSGYMKGARDRDATRRDRDANGDMRSGATGVDRDGR